MTTTATPYADRDTADRLRIMDTCTAAGSHFYRSEEHTSELQSH